MSEVCDNVRKQGQYYPLGAYAEVLHRKELKEELIKLQHNVRSPKKTCFRLYIHAQSPPLFHRYIGFTIGRKQQRLIQAI